LAEQPKSVRRGVPDDPGADRQRDLSGGAGPDWEEHRAEIWGLAFPESNQSPEAPLEGTEPKPAPTPDEEKYRAWLHEFLDQNANLYGSAYEKTKRRANTLVAGRLLPESMKAASRTTIQ
jgi:hypothetical protein